MTFSLLVFFIISLLQSSLCSNALSSEGLSPVSLLHSFQTLFTIKIVVRSFSASLHVSQLLQHLVYSVLYSSQMLFTIKIVVSNFSAYPHVSKLFQNPCFSFLDIHHPPQFLKPSESVTKFSIPVSKSSVNSILKERIPLLLHPCHSQPLSGCTQMN